MFKTEPSFHKIGMDSFFKRKIGNPCWFHSATINFSGDVLPCIRAKNSKVGNVRIDSLKKLLIENALEEYWYLSKDRIKICKDCEFRYVCNDCRVIALSSKGGMFSRDILCKYDPYTSNWE